MNHFKIIYTDGTTQETQANGNAAEFEAYLKQFGGTITDENPATGEETKRTIYEVQLVASPAQLRAHVENKDGKHFSGTYKLCTTCRHINGFTAEWDDTPDSSYATDEPEAYSDADPGL